MTNAELIKALRNCSSPRVGSCMDCPYYKCVSCKWQMMEDAADALEAAEKRIKELETRLPKDVEWLEDDTTYCGADLANYKCSLCGKIGGTWRRGLKQDKLPPYCPNCGARMQAVTDCHTLEGER